MVLAQQDAHTGNISGAVYSLEVAPSVRRAATSAGTNLDSPRSASSYVGRHPTRSRTTMFSSFRSLREEGKEGRGGHSGDTRAINLHMARDTLSFVHVRFIAYK